MTVPRRSQEIGSDAEDERGAHTARDSTSQGWNARIQSDTGMDTKALFSRMMCAMSRGRVNIQNEGD